MRRGHQAGRLRLSVLGGGRPFRCHPACLCSERFPEDFFGRDFKDVVVGSPAEIPALQKRESKLWVTPYVGGACDLQLQAATCFSISFSMFQASPAPPSKYLRRFMDMGADESGPIKRGEAQVHSWQSPLTPSCLR